MLTFNVRDIGQSSAATSTHARHSCGHHTQHWCLHHVIPACSKRDEARILAEYRAVRSMLFCNAIIQG